MRILPEIGFHWLNGFLLVFPMLIVRLGIPFVINKKSLGKLEYFPPVIGKERLALRTYFIINPVLLFSPLLFHIRTKGWIMMSAFVLFVVAMIFLTLSTWQFIQTVGFVKNGIYKYSRNPMYLGYLLLFLSVGVAIGSLLYLILVFVYQIAVHLLVLSEERWCIDQFGEQYRKYKEEVPRYLM